MPEKQGEPSSEPKEEVEKVEDEVETPVNTEEEEVQPEEEVAEAPPLISTDDITGDLLGLNEVNPKALELEASNALALAIIPAGGDHPSSSNHALSELDRPNATGWELALVTTPSTNASHVVESKLAGGFDKLLLDSLYEDDKARRQIQLQNAGYGYGGMVENNPFEQQDPFVMSNNTAPPPSVQMAMMAQEQHQYQQQQQQQMMMVPYQYQYQYPQRQMQQMGSSNPFGDPFANLPQNSIPQQGNHMLL
ncbi:hypothetical protein P3X46_022536 [Hevea brasiliensis]|uniref:Clathrin assembly protein n=1 Tax=Hevea brasiliensis TaxID=3981 RepID=A0ABQ9L875_HEVBR|nr:hypothetical protein P3X46_022536 [Hevea brasiliensis]